MHDCWQHVPAIISSHQKNLGALSTEAGEGKLGAELDRAAIFIT